MPPKKDNKDIQINLKNQSSLAEFTKRPIPNEKEMEKFDEYLEKARVSQNQNIPPVADMANQDREEEIEEGLSEIYQDESGHMADVSKLTIKKKRGFLFWFLFLVLSSSILSLFAYFSYNYFYFKSRSDATAFDFSIKVKDNVVSGEEFFYILKYKNKNIVPIKNVEIKVKFPDNFVFLDSSPLNKSTEHYVWNFNELKPGQDGEIKIKGKIIDKENNTAIVLATARYVPENFSSEFKKDASATLKIKSVGLNFDFDYLSSALVGEDSQIEIELRPDEDNYFNSFRINIEPQENLNILSLKAIDNEKIQIEEVRNGVWNIGGFEDEKFKLALSFKFIDKVKDKENLIINFEKRAENNNFYEFYSKNIEIEVVKSNLLLTTIINGSRDDFGVNLGDTLNYTIAYSNKGETEMKNLLIMAVLEGDLLDWGTLKDDLGGKKRGNTITWTKEELPGLEYLAPGKEGLVNFSIQILNKNNVSESDDFEIKSYARYGLGEEGDDSLNLQNDANNKSNTIINKINSDLDFSEELRYFSKDDDLPVGTGPICPRVGATSSYKVYWRLTNTLHDLEDVEVYTVLPKYVNFAQKQVVSVGKIHYDQVNNKVIWKIGRLPASVGEVDAEFSISFAPNNEHKNKAMILLSGSSAEAVDSETKASIFKTSSSQTTVLKDDKSAYAQTGGDGVIQ